MRTAKQIQLFLFVSLTSVLLTFNNCSGTFEAAKNLDAVGLGVNLPNSPRLDGAALYATNCLNCHGPLANSQKRNKSAASISTAIRSLKEMKHLSFLTPAEVSAISDALSGVIVLPPSPAGEPTKSKPVIGNRFMIKENLKEIFLADSGRDGSDNAIEAIIDDHVGTHSEAFGGNCTRYDAGCMPKNCDVYGETECVGKLAGHMMALPLPSPSPVAKGYIFRACEEALTNDKAVVNALIKSGLSTASPIDAVSITSLMKFMYRDRPVNNNAINSLIALASQSQSKGYNTTDQWRFIILPLCVSGAADLL